MTPKTLAQLTAEIDYAVHSDGPLGKTTALGLSALLKSLAAELTTSSVQSTNLYSTTGTNIDGAMTQKATTDAANVVQEALDAFMPTVATYFLGNPANFNTQLGPDPIDVIINGDATNNTFGSSYQGFVLGNGHFNNVYGSRIEKSILGDGYNENVFGSGLRNVTLGNNYTGNTFDSGVQLITGGDNIYYCVVNSGCYNVEFGSDCYNVQLTNCRGDSIHSFFVPAGTINAVYINNIKQPDLPNQVTLYPIYGPGTTQGSSIGQALSITQSGFGHYRTITTNNVASFTMQLPDGTTLTNPTTIDYPVYQNTQFIFYGTVVDQYQKGATITLSTLP